MVNYDQIRRQCLIVVILNKLVILHDHHLIWDYAFGQYGGCASVVALG